MFVLYKSVELPIRLSNIHEVSIQKALAKEIGIRQEFFERLLQDSGSQIILGSLVLSTVFFEAIRDTLSGSIEEIAMDDDESYVIMPVLRVIDGILRQWPKRSYTAQFLKSPAFLGVLVRILYSPSRQEQDFVCSLIALILKKIQHKGNFGEYLAALRGRIGRLLHSAVLSDSPTLTRPLSKALLMYEDLVKYEAKDHGFFREYLLTFIDSPSLPTVLTKFKTIFTQRLSFLKSTQDPDYNVETSLRVFMSSS